jgi:stearoyl-CoA desaturase (delta-9 desaturase)
MTVASPPRRGLAHAVRSLVDNDAADQARPREWSRGVALPRVLPFVILHLGCLGVLWVGWSPFAVGVAIAGYLVRGFFVTAFYHRYFSHRAFRTSRVVQFVFAVLGNSAVQRGPLWWASHHRNHHASADREDDPHSPHEHGLYWSHMGWLTSQHNFPTRLDLIQDFARYRELRLLERFDVVVPLLYAGGLFGLGAALAHWAPGLGTSGPQLLVWGFFVSTVILLHVTSLVNSASHWWGTRRFETKDGSRNNWWVAILALGEGWHNNHHRYPAAARQGFYWWEIDVTYYLLRCLAGLGIIWDLNPVPRHVLQAGTAKRPAG